MKIISAFAVATLLGTSFAIAQAASPPGAASPQSAPPPSSSPQSGAAAPSHGDRSSTESTTSGKHMSYRACAKEAKTKHLKGSERKQFIKDCEAGKSSG